MWNWTCEIGTVWMSCVFQFTCVLVCKYVREFFTRTTHVKTRVGIFQIALTCGLNVREMTTCVPHVDFSPNFAPHVDFSPNFFTC